MRRIPVPGQTLTDAQVNESIRQGIGYLLYALEQPKSLEFGDDSVMSQGRLSLVLLALLHAGEAAFDERLTLSGPLMTGLFDRVKAFPMEGRLSTYARSIRAQALSVHARKADLPALRADVQWLLRSGSDGRYGYELIETADKKKPENAWWDNSNSQYGTLGVWSAALAGVDVKELGHGASYWKRVEEHWTNAQSTSGGWAYTGGGAATGTLAMTAAGVNMLFVARDELNADRVQVGIDQEPFPESLEKGLAWLSYKDNSVSLPHNHQGYTLYGLERAGLASGFKQFGTHDWYRELGTRVVSSQLKDGSWDGDDGRAVETAFRLLFLARGRHPILMNKARFAGAWANRPRDLVRLTRFVYQTIERPLNWQVVNLNAHWEEWSDAPILYLASHVPPELTEQDEQHLRDFVQAGGLLFTHADTGSTRFNVWAEELAYRLFPQYELKPVPEDHPLYSVIYPMEVKPPLRAVSNGARLLMVHSPADLAQVWQNRDPDKRVKQYQLGANLFVYATGKHPLRNRLETLYYAEPVGAGAGTIPVARIRFDGDWDPEPGAWPSFARWFGWETGIRVATKAVEPSALSVDVAPMAHLTGVSAPKLRDADYAALLRYVESGGVLLIDTTGGNAQANAAARKALLAKISATNALRPLEANHPLLAGKAAGMEPLPETRMRVFAVSAFGRSGPQVEAASVGKGLILFSRLDLTSGLMGTTTWGILGYDPAYCRAFAKNLLLWVGNERDIFGNWQKSPADAAK